MASSSDDGSSTTRSISGSVSLDVVLAEANERRRAHEFCVLVGNTLWSYSDAWAYAKGDLPTVSVFWCDVVCVIGSCMEMHG